MELDPLELGVPRSSLADLRGGDPAVNAAVVREVVAGRPGPIRDVVVLNAAAALVAYGKPTASRLGADFVTELERAQQAIDSGAAQIKLGEWIEATHAVH